ncbi:MAG: PAS domain S-box protein [Steroidobacteraceae bacterium]
MNAHEAQGSSFRYADSRTLPVVARDIQPIPLSWKAGAGFVAAYAALLTADYALQASPGEVTAIWPSDGLLLATLLLLRKRDWPWIIVMATVLDVLTNRLTPGPFYLDSAIWYALTSALDGAVGAALTQRWIRGKSSLGQAVGFYFAAAVSCTLSTTLAVPMYLSKHPEVGAFTEWWMWWSGSFLGIVAVTPLSYLWITRWRRTERARPMAWWRRHAILNILLIALTVWIFGAVPAISVLGSNLSFAIFPILVLVALHGPPRWAMAGAAVVVALAAALTDLGAGPFANPATPFGGVLSLQLFLALAVVMTLMISMAGEENRALLVALTLGNRRSRRETRLLREEIERNRALEQQRVTAERRNAQLAALVRHSQEFIGISTLDGRGDFINDVGRELVGIGPEESAGRYAIADFVHAREHERFAREVMPTVLASGRWSGELDFRRIDDGIAIPMLVTAFRIDDVDGRPLWIANVGRDVTERKRTAERLRTSELRLRTIIETEPDCVKIVSGQGTLLEMNASGLAMLEAKSVDEVNARGLINFICPEYRSPFLDLHQRVMEGERGELDFEVVGLQGTRRWLHTFSAPMWDDTLAETVLLGITSDITERRRLETKLVSEATRNRLFLRTASDGVHILNSTGHIVDVSESFCKMLGYEREEVIGMYPSQWDAQLTSEEVHATFAALKNGELKRFNTLHRRKDGSTFPVEIHTERFDIEGEIYEYCSSRDMTDQRRLERALLEATSNEQHKLGRDVHDGLGQELAGISMIASAIATSLSKAGRPEATELANLANLARNAVANCRAIAHGLSPVAFADSDLVEVLQEMVALQQRSFDINARCEIIQAAPLRLAPETIENLYRISQEAVTNSRRHGRAKSIQVKLDIQPATVRLEVQDDGVGLGSSPEKSTGMGLKIMQVRAAIIGGRLSIGPGKYGGTLMSCECPQPARND